MSSARDAGVFLRHHTTSFRSLHITVFKTRRINNDTDDMPYRKQTLDLYCDCIYTNREWDVECTDKYSYRDVFICSKPVCVDATY